MPARTPGPIAAPEPLLTTLAEYRQLHLALADSEPGHAWLAALELPCELEIDALARQEEALGASFSDALLAVLAARVPHLEDSWELSLELGPLAAEARGDLYALTFCRITATYHAHLAAGRPELARAEVEGAMRRAMACSNWPACGCGTKT